MAEIRLKIERKEGGVRVEAHGGGILIGAASPEHASRRAFVAVEAYDTETALSMLAPWLVMWDGDRG